MLETKRKNIEGLDVAVTQFAGRRNFSLLLNIAKVVGPTMAAAGSNVKSTEDLMNADLDIDRIGQVLFNSMDTRVVTGLVDDLLSSTFVNDRPLSDQFDEVFAGPDLWKLPKIIAFVIEVNFGNFSGLVASVSGVAAQRAEGLG